MPQEPEKTGKERRSSDERRQYKRIAKSFILSYFDKKNRKIKCEITQLRNTSMGGMCFVTTQAFAPGTELIVDLNTPYLTDITHLSGKVLESHPKAKGILYETRLEFDKLSTEAEYVIAKMMEVFLEGDVNRREKN